jgi:multidrug resistance protein, MATE family
VGAAVSPLLTGNLRRELFWLALPTLGEQLLGSMVTIVDAWLAGHLSRDAVNAVGFSVYISWLVWMVFTAIGAGATAVVARSIGAGRRGEARTAVSQALGVAVMAGVAATAVVVSTAPLIAWIVWGGQGPATPMRQFLQIEALGHVFVSVTAIGIGCIRASGDTRTPLAIMGVVNLWNVGVSSTLVHVFGLGVRGIAAGTASARAIGGLVTLAVLLSRHTKVRLALSRMWPQARWVWRLVRIGLPAALESGSFWVVQVIFVTIIKHSAGYYNGEINFAAHVIGLRIESLSYMPANAWAFAGGTLMGQCLGAGLPDRARRVGYEACLQGGLLITLMGFVYYFAPAVVFRQFTNDPLVIAAGIPAMKLLAFLQPFLAVWIIMGGCLRGSGDTRVPFLITLVSGFLLRLPVGYLGGITFDGGLVGAWVGMCLDVAARCVLFCLRFVRGGWQKVKV